jgi:hypothetical protein
VNNAKQVVFLFVGGVINVIFYGIIHRKCIFYTFYVGAFVGVFAANAPHGRRPTVLFALGTYGVADGAVAPTSPDSSGSPQRRDAVSAS